MKTKDYEKLGRMLESIFESGYISHKRVYFINLFRGIFFGFGSVLGGTIVLAIVLWILSLFTEVPFLGQFVESFKETINSKSIQ